MDFNGIFKYAREGQGLKQNSIAKKAGITHVALSRFESGKTSLSVETLKKIADELNIIDKNFVTGESFNPFRSYHLIKMFLPEIYGSVKFIPIEEILVEYNQAAQFILLVRSRRSKLVQKITEGEIEAPYAILALDQDNNIFIFRRQRSSEYIVDELSMQAWILEKARTEKKRITFITRRMTNDLYNRIRTWEVEREHVEDFFTEHFLRVSESEKLILNEIKNNKIDPRIILRFIESLKEKSLKKGY